MAEDAGIALAATTIALTAFRTSAWPPVRIVPATSKRPWIDQTRDHFAYRCLPLVMANQNGWLLLSPQEITVEWDGSDRTRGLKISSSEPSNRLIAKSHFGSGIVTWTLPWLFRTSPGYNLLIRGPSNIPKDGIYPLEGLVETDWSITSFTMNWKVTRPHVPITFEQGEPFAMILPQRRHELEQVVPQERSINDDPELKKAFMEWSKSRGQFMRDLKQPGTDAAKQVWQRHYTQGKSPSGMMAPEHQTRMHLKDFEPG